MQNSVSEGAPYEPPSPIVASAPYNNEAASTSFDSNGSPAPVAETTSYSYDEVFPALPQSSIPTSTAVNHLGQRNNKMRIGSSIVTQVFVIPHEESKFDLSEKFGESESMRTCHNIMQATGATIEISSNKDQSLTFLVTGKLNSVAEAKRRILTCFQTQADVILNIPKEHHRYLLGKGGQKLKDLEKITACKISVPNISDPSDAIKITGSKEGIEKAVHEIRVTSDEQSKQAYERISVPKMYHPFICGGHNEKLNQLMQETNVRVNVPPASVQNNEITIAGEKEGVQVAKDRILAIFKEMEKKCSQVSVEVPKSQHRYVIGFKGNTIAEILQKTGVSVEMPPADSTTDTITLRGPQDKLGLALNMVYNKANSVLATTVNASAWLHKYVIGRKGANIKKITQDLSKGVHVEFTENKIKIEGPREEVEKAQAELEKVVQEFENSHTYEELNVDPKYYKHIIGKGGANVNRLKEETGVLINIREEDGVSSNIIRIEGNREGVLSVKKKLQEIVTNLENEKVMNIDHRFFPSIIGTKGDKIREIKELYSQVQIIFPHPADKKGAVVLRGPKEEVEKCSQHLSKIVQELTEENTMLEVPILKQFHKFVIGKGGANIKKIRDETQTKIELPSEDERSDVIRIIGREENVLQAKERIQKIQDELAPMEHGNIVTEEITIPPKFYNSLIGPGGKLIHSISEECGGVQIKFPTSESKSDKVTIKGLKEDVEKARQQLETLKNEREAASYTAEVKAKPQHHKFLIGKSGAKIKKIRDSTGARIIFPSEKDEDKETITIIGKKEQVEQARAELEKTIKEVDNLTEAEMTVNPIHHKHFVSRRGEVIQQITNECGGTVTISFPRPNCESDKVTLKGFKESIEIAKAKIESIVKDLESMITIECVIPQKHHRTVMGSKGTKVQNITSDYKVQIKFPERDAQGDSYQGQEENGGQAVRPCDVIKITGKPENCQAAKEALEKLVPVTIEVPVAFELHRSIIGKSGGSVRQLMDDFDVHIVLSPADQKLDCIKISGAPANVDKAREALEERVKQLEKDKQDRQLKSFSLSVNVDPEFHPKIIGKKGAVISEIRSTYGVQITLPKRGDPEEHIITIQGYEEKAIAARDHILGIVNKLKQRTKEEIEVDSRVHSRLIGQKGRSIRKLMDKYQVEIKFPRPGDSNPNLVTIIGAEDNILDAKEEILNLEENYLGDLPFSKETMNCDLNIWVEKIEQGDGDSGFIIRGGPWEQPQQRRPDTASTEDFPSFGTAAAGEGHTIVWGPRPR
ncbi:hypothetical protein RUM43_013682 [Polyplax serrata]|uniref:K Homology domain-containing protein n=1 Tax=Polyplax serrata TaxID=468196 RepID=A0AAN8P0T8_POLSC